MYRMTTGVKVSAKKCTLPSMNTALQPPGWNENGSSFNPWLFDVQRCPTGPPVG